MNKEYKVEQYTNTQGTINYKKFISKKFTPTQLTNKLDGVTYFNGFSYKNMGNWERFKTDDGLVIEFYPNNYIINYKSNKLTLPHPETIEIFIMDVLRIYENLLWDNTIDAILDPKDFLNQNKIEHYYREMLKIMGKDEELL